ncbi:MAG: DfrB family trimethoprim-resistant dihydrofolate reductase [Candidatus Contendobacter sp.]|jgi:dihydrofolate reductase (trimethoprim resistance protein)|nr:DfrB family trimethoprim-resistant dihydrofolate reductase [Candidatus Contendobacter sp.]
MIKQPCQDAIPWANSSPPTYRLGDRVQKHGGARWRGKVVGWYRTSLTPEGYAVESAFEPGSVQIYPVTALDPWDGVS